MNCEQGSGDMLLFFCSVSYIHGTGIAGKPEGFCFYINVNSFNFPDRNRIPPEKRGYFLGRDELVIVMITLRQILCTSSGRVIISLRAFGVLLFVRKQ